MSSRHFSVRPLRVTSELIAARMLHMGFPRCGRRTPEELRILTWAGLCLAALERI